MSESTTTSRTQPHERPLSPHLTIYKLPLTAAIMSITHRITGVLIAVGLVVFVAWLWIAAYCPKSYAPFVEILTSWCGQTVLAGWTLAFFYHLLNGVRHLFWDMGEGLDLPAAHRSGLIVLVGSVLLTFFIWCGNLYF
jgi:succinate dehydrogenase / fumarate reductase cytochrome b subunit